jgi:molybdate transport system substrate-binding protein
MRVIGSGPAAAVIGAVLAAAPACADDLMVFAAASLEESLTEAAEAWAAEGHPKLVLSFAASSVLAKQIENGAPADLFVSADERWMEYLADRSLVVAASRTPFLENELVLIAPASRPFQIEWKPGGALAEVLGDEKLALADVDSVPAGRYGKAALTSLGVWESVERNVVRQTDVRAALALVERDEARAGIVYRTDAMASRKVVIAAVFPATSHPPIVYPLAIVEGHASPDVHRLHEFLLSARAKEIFARHGFRVNESRRRP